MEWTTSLEATVHPCRYDHHDLDEYDNDHHDYGDDIKGGLHLYSFPPQRGSDLAKIDAADRALEDKASPESHPVTQIESHPVTQITP